LVHIGLPRDPEFISRLRSHCSSWGVDGSAPYSRSKALWSSKPARNISDIAHERLVEDLTLRRLHAHGPHENEPAKAWGAMVAISARSAAEAQADEGNVAGSREARRPWYITATSRTEPHPRRPLRSIVAGCEAR